MLSEKGKLQRNLQNIHSFKPKKKYVCVFEYREKISDMNYIRNVTVVIYRRGLPRWCSGKRLPANAGDTRDSG